MVAVATHAGTMCIPTVTASRAAVSQVVHRLRLGASRTAWAW